MFQILIRSCFAFIFIFFEGSGTDPVFANSIKHSHSLLSDPGDSSTSAPGNNHNHDDADNAIGSVFDQEQVYTSSNNMMESFSGKRSVMSDEISSNFGQKKRELQPDSLESTYKTMETSSDKNETDSGDNPNDSEKDPPLPKDPAQQTPDHASWAMLILCLTLFITLMISYFLTQYHVTSLHVSIIALLLGMIIGLASMNKWRVEFDNQYFFNLLLPPIILHSGYDLNVESFIRHFWKVLLFAFLGTFISTVVIGYLMYLWVLVGSTRSDLVECLMFGSILSSTDPITTLAVFKTLNLDKSLYALIFGESMLNDAVSIVLYQTINEFRKQASPLHFIDVGAQGTSDAMASSGTNLTVIGAVFNFLVSFMNSTLLGIGSAFICAFLLKKTQLDRHPTIESSVLALIAYSAYFLSNAIELSGIVSLLFCGITMKYYSFPSLSLKSKRMTSYLFSIMSNLSENFIFIYLGITLFTQKEVFRPGEIFTTFLFLLIARAASVYPLAWLVNFQDAVMSKNGIGFKKWFQFNVNWWKKFWEDIAYRYLVLKSKLSGSAASDATSSLINGRNRSDTGTSGISLSTSSLNNHSVIQNIVPSDNYVGENQYKFSIPPKHQLVMWWSGLRGAIAFALSMDVKSEQLIGGKRRVEEVRTTTLSVVVLSILLLGGTVAILVKRIGGLADISSTNNLSYNNQNARNPRNDHVSSGILNNGNDSLEDTTGVRWFIWLDKKFLKPFFVKSRGVNRGPDSFEDDDQDHDEEY